jgi:hypothetical protein
MQQEVRATVTLTYSADATLSASELLDKIVQDVARLTDADGDSGIELQSGSVHRVREEAEIYQSDVPSTKKLGYTDYRCPECGGDHCGNDATSGWDVVTQESVLNSEYDDQWCNDCGEVSLEEYEITDRAEIARIDEERTRLRLLRHGDQLAALLRKAETALEGVVHPMCRKEGDLLSEIAALFDRIEKEA